MAGRPKKECKKGTFNKILKFVISFYFARLKPAALVLLFTFPKRGPAHGKPFFSNGNGWHHNLGRKFSHEHFVLFVVVAPWRFVAREDTRVVKKVPRLVFHICKLFYVSVRVAWNAEYSVTPPSLLGLRVGYFVFLLTWGRVWGGGRYKVCESLKSKKH